MYTRLVILTAIVVAAVCGLGGLGFHAIGKWAQGLEGARLGEFAEVAEQVRQDVKRKLDEFIRVEQQRKYTDYLYSYVPENIVDAAQLPLLRSPLGSQLSNYFAYGYFQIEPGGNVVTPYYPGEPPRADTQDETAQALQHHYSNIWDNVLPSISARGGMLELPPPRPDVAEENEAAAALVSAKEDAANQVLAGRKGFPDSLVGRAKAYPIESLQQKTQQVQIFQQQRSVVASNQAQVAQPSPQQSFDVMESPTPQQGSTQADRFTPVPEGQLEPPLIGPPLEQAEQTIAPGTTASAQRDQSLGAGTGRQRSDSDTVQIRIEPFVPLVVPDPSRTQSIFGGQVFLLRHVQIENRHLLQGFQLDEHRLIAEVEGSARTFVRDGMGFELAQARTAGARVEGVGLPNAKQSVGDPVPPSNRGQDARDTAYTAILDFGFGDLALHLTELDPAWITKRIGELHRVYFGIIAIMVVAVALSLTSLWHNVRAQIALARKKDDFISAVSHELRTPLTSIRMYTEMLEKNWVKSQDKVAEYHRTMRQESERLSRLVENVLDFARLQKGRESYAFKLGNVNDCIAGVVEMMRPCAAQHGFTIRTDLAATEPTRFDTDAVTQIIVNLIDNAVKYARCATDKAITVRTRSEPGFTIVEVEDHGPGIPHRQQKKVFEQFYRCEDDSVGAGPRACPPSAGQPQTTGMGLGLTLVKRFAEAHAGFVEIDSARPTGAIFRVALATGIHPAL